MQRLLRWEKASWRRGSPSHAFRIERVGKGRKEIVPAKEVSGQRENGMFEEMHSEQSGFWEPEPGIGLSSH